MTLSRLLGFVSILEYYVRKINAAFPIKQNIFASICDYEFWKCLLILITCMDQIHVLYRKWI